MQTAGGYSSSAASKQNQIDKSKRNWGRDQKIETAADRKEWKPGLGSANMKEIRNSPRDKLQKQQHGADASRPTTTPGQKKSPRSHKKLEKSEDSINAHYWGTHDANEVVKPGKVHPKTPHHAHGKMFHRQGDDEADFVHRHVDQGQLDFANALKHAAEKDAEERAQGLTN